MPKHIKICVLEVLEVLKGQEVLEVLKRQEVLDVLKGNEVHEVHEVLEQSCFCAQGVFSHGS